MKRHRLDPIVLSVAALGMLARVAAGAPATKAKPATSASASASVSAAPSASATVSGPKPLSETLQGEAKQDFETGSLAYKNKDYASAIVKLRRAYDLSKDPRILWNMALCEQQLRHYAEATRLFRRYLSEGEFLVSDKDREDANKKLTEMEPFTATLHFAIDQSDAEVFVDDASMGKTPLDAAGLLVDIGNHKIIVKKAGFHDATSTVFVDGSKRDVPVAIAMQVELHQGHVEIRATLADAEIFIDGKLVGKGSWTGILESRGHTLRVVAPGMRTYDRELVVSDGDHRIIDVAMEREVVVEEPYDSGDLALRLGAGTTFRDSQDKQSGFDFVGADIGVRLGRPTILGLGFDFGTISPSSGTCGFGLRTSQDPNSDYDPAAGNRFFFTSCKFIAANIFLAVHFLPRSRFDPWFEVHLRGIGVFLSLQKYDVASSGFVSAHEFGGATQAGGRLGLDVRPLDAFRAFSVGPYLQFDYSIIGGVGKGDDPARSTDGGHPWSSLIFGVRTALTF